MSDPLRNKMKALGLTAGAFAGGIVLASGFQWTAGSQAATLMQTAPAPARQDIRPVAELSQAFISIAESVTPAVVSIETERVATRSARDGIPEGMRDMFPFSVPERGGQPVPQEASGSGFIISADGYVITNNHVVEGATKITVVLGDNRSLPARVVGRDPNTDVAVIKLEGSGFPTVRLGSSEATRIGEWVLAIGNPLDLGTTVTSGIVSAKGRALPILRQATGSRWAIEDFIQTDAPINPGNSGGPLVNLRGEVVGVNSAIASPTGFYSGYGFAVPIDLARKVADDLVRFGRVRRPQLGITLKDVSPEDAEVFKLSRISGVVVNDFPAGATSPARDAGVRRGDVIVGVDGAVVERTGQLQRLVATRRPGDQITLDVVRYGSRQQLRVKLGEAPADPQQQAAATPAPAPASGPADPLRQRLGLAVQPVDAQLAARYQLSGPGGIVITRVDPFGPAGQRDGVREGTRILSVDGERVTDEATLHRMLGRKRAGQVMSLVIEDGTGQQGIENIRLR
ncbi:MAG TPA: trypsin-like peptidase domain-containing protein [Longimicrobium sp.]|nr:trypsin-like peptidase domain-containing protein [Longimicrobium sp.]